MLICMLYWLGVYGVAVAVVFSTRDLMASWRTPQRVCVNAEEMTQGMMFEWAVCVCLPPADSGASSARRMGFNRRIWIYRDELSAQQWVALRKVLRGVLTLERVSR